MPRALLLAAAVLLVGVACSTPDAPRATATPAPGAPAGDATPVAVHILVPEAAEPAVAAWAQEFDNTARLQWGSVLHDRPRQHQRMSAVEMS